MGLSTNQIILTIGAVILIVFPFLFGGFIIKYFESTYESPNEELFPSLVYKEKQAYGIQMLGFIVAGLSILYTIYALIITSNNKLRTIGIIGTVAGFILGFLNFAAAAYGILVVFSELKRNKS